MQHRIVVISTLWDISANLRDRWIKSIFEKVCLELSKLE